MCGRTDDRQNFRRRPPCQHLGASWADMIDILEKFDVINACGLSSGSAVSLYTTQYLRPKQLNAAPTLGSRQSYLPAFWVVRG